MTRLGLIALLICGLSIAAYADQRPDVLLIIVDDLKTELNCYGASRAFTPNIDGLAAEGMTFLSAYCQAAKCEPSRQSFLTGVRPNAFGKFFREALPDVVTLPQQFGKHGYRTRAIGKVFHNRDDQSWDEPQWAPDPDFCYPIYGTDENLSVQRDRIENEIYFKKGSDWWAKGDKWNPAGVWEAPEVEDNLLTDGKFADKAIEMLRELKGEPFFLAIGFFRPHIPFIAPKKYYDLYPLEEIQLPDDNQLPKGAPAFAAQTGGEWRRYHNVAKAPKMPDVLTQREYIRGYLASVSYMDAQVGRVLDELERLNMADNTIVVFMADHGYHLFDKNSFGKSTNFENATRVPFIVRQPGASHPGAKTHALIELVDLYPSLCDLAGLPIPEHTLGQSFKATLSNPQSSGKEAAFSRYPRSGYMGESVRTARYRLTRWTKDNEEVLELYDYKNDLVETVNLSQHPKHESTMAELSALLDGVF